MKTRLALTALALLAIVTMSSCAPFASAAGQASLDTATVMPTAFGTGTLEGSVTYGGEPLAGARVELRTADWRTSPQPVVAVAMSDDAGRYSIGGIPDGSYSLVAMWPDGQDDAAGYPTIEVPAGQAAGRVDG